MIDLIEKAVNELANLGVSPKIIMLNEFHYVEFVAEINKIIEHTGVKISGEGIIKYKGMKIETKDSYSFTTTQSHIISEEFDKYTNRYFTRKFDLTTLKELI